jgi:hypothetical protein
MESGHITEEEVEDALEYLRTHAVPAAQARANREYVSEYRKTIKAKIMQEYRSLPIGAQEREAYADPRYVEYLNAIREAVEADEKHTFLRAAAMARLDCWRTQSSNERAMRI